MTAKKDARCHEKMPKSEKNFKDRWRGRKLEVYTRSNLMQKRALQGQV